MNQPLHFVVTAGGTGGHMVPAHVLARILRSRGHQVALVTDDRGLRFPGLFEDVPRHVIRSGTLSGGPLGWMKAWLRIRAGKKAARRLYRSFRPQLVVGFGGYPVLPAMLAARSQRIATVIHEQNSVLGRVNRLLARHVDLIATAYADVARLPARAAARVVLIGNPVRQDILALRDDPYPMLSDDGPFRVLVVGGSQGATILSDVVPDGLGLLPPNFRSRLQVTQQCRPEDIGRVRETYARLGIAAECATYLEDLADRLAWAHLVIARSGASTVAELTVAGRPAILIPFAAATDDHQTSNCAEIVAAGGARMIAQNQFTPIELAKQMQKLGLESAALTNAAERARQAGRPDAGERLADMVEELARARAARSPRTHGKK